jgi:pyruvate dehydrogenase E1 component alpha subunit
MCSIDRKRGQALAQPPCKPDLVAPVPLYWGSRRVAGLIVSLGYPPDVTQTSDTAVHSKTPTGAAMPDPSVMVGWLGQMLLIREFEVRCMQAYQNRLIGGFCHVYIGQEAVAVGTIGSLNPDDPIITAYRCHGHALARQLDPKYAMAELFGRIGGCAKGKGGSMHLFDRDHHMFGGHGIVAAQTPVGTGLAFACKYEDEVINDTVNSRVAVTYLGDGALNQGSLHEAMNLASVLDIPVIFVVENNGYSMGTSIDRGTSNSQDLTAKAKAYGMHSAVIDGMDVCHVYRDFKPIVDYCREHSRPAFVDIKTYRYKGHSMSDPRKYRTHEEEAAAEANDSIDLLTTRLIEMGAITSESRKAMAQEAKSRIRTAVKWAEASPPPSLEELYHDVFVQEWGPYTGTSLPECVTKSEREDLL